MMAAIYTFWLICGTGLFLFGGVSSYECYSQFCTEKDCLSPDNAAKCTADEFGCKVYVTVRVGRSVRWDAECQRTAACANSSVGAETGVLTRTGCCNANLCNLNLPEVTKGSNQCYLHTCVGEDCLKYGIGNKTVSACPKTAEGCFVRKAHAAQQKVSYDVGCSSPNDACTALKMAAMDIHCCKDDLCNNGQVPPPPVPQSGAQPRGRVTLTMTALAVAIVALYTIVI